MKLETLFILSGVTLLAACGGSSSTSTDTSTFSSSSIFNDDILAITLAENSSDIYVGGAFTSYNGTAVNRVIRLNSDGSIDNGFDVGSGFDLRVISMAAANDGSGDIYVSGRFTSYNGTSVKRIIRLNDDGTIDSAFNIGTGFDDLVLNIAAATDGSGDIYAVGQFSVFRGNNRNGIVRINSDGSNDTGFDTGSGFNGDIRFNGTVFTVLAATDGSGDIYVGGAFATYRGATSNGLVRIDSSSAISTGFDVGSGFDGASAQIFVTSIAEAADTSGDIYVAGNFTSYRGNPRNGIVRINSNGINNANFDDGTGFENITMGVNPTVRSVAVTTDGSSNVYAGGSFSSYDGTLSNGLACLESTGLLCVNFDRGSGTSSTVRVITAANDGSGDIYVVGSFPTYNGTTVGRIVRIDSAGRLK
jgi:hypothetical protein